MEKGETAPQLSRKELRKQKLMEYLAAKGRTKLPNLKPYLRENSRVKKPVACAAKIAPGKENKCPAETLKYQNPKVPQPVGKATAQPAWRAFGVTNRADAKGRAQPNTTCRAASAISAQSGTNRHPVLKSTAPAASSRFNLNTAGHTLRPPDKRMQSSGRISTLAPSHNRAWGVSKAVGSVPANLVGARTSLGTLVKTKTGLIPTLPQPRKTKPRSSHIPPSSAGNYTSAVSVANKVQSATSSKKSVTPLRKTFTTAAPNNPVYKRTTLSAVSTTQNKVHAPKETNAKPAMGKQTGLGQIPGGLKPLPASKSKTAAAKPVGRDEASKTDKAAPERADGSAEPKPEPEGQKMGQKCKVPVQKTTGPRSRCSLRAASGATQGVARSTQSTERCRSASATLPRAATDAKWQRLSRPVSAAQTTGAALQKSSARVIPQTDAKQLTAAQQDRMNKLQEWREARGISYKRPPMPTKPQVRRSQAVSHPFWTSMKEEDDAHSLICAVDRSLADCIKLLKEGCPVDQVKGVLSRLPTVSHKFAKYWICRVRVMEQEGELDVLPVFEEAVGVVLEPVDELRTVVFDILRKRDCTQASEEKEDGIPSTETCPQSDVEPTTTPKAVRVLISGEKGNSSVVKYKITATPGGRPSLQREPVRVNNQEVHFFTPVRRSVRIERASIQYPAALRDHDVCVASYNDLVSTAEEEEKEEEEEEQEEEEEEQEDGRTSPSVTEPMIYIYRENDALKDKVSVQLVYD